MERRNFISLCLGVAAGVAAITVSAQAAPLTPQSLAQPNQPSAANPEFLPAVISSDELSDLKPELVRWHWHRHWHHRWHHWHRHW